MAVIKAQEYSPANNVQYRLKVKLCTEKKMVIFTGLGWVKAEVKGMGAEKAKGEGRETKTKK